MGEQNRNSGSMHDRTVYQRKKSEKWELKGLKQKNVSCSIMDRRQTALDMGIQSGSMKSAGTVLIGSVQAKVRVLR